jgi:hypothetical protein
MSSRYGYYGKDWYVYIAKLIRKYGDPKVAYKIGITNARDPMLRLTYQGTDEPYPILKYFPDIQLLHYVIVPSEYQAERLERKVMGIIKKMSGDPRFHNWKEPDQISGITEMRIWSWNEVQECIAIMNGFRYN